MGKIRTLVLMNDPILEFILIFHLIAPSSDLIVAVPLPLLNS